jgi:hypothetical protein
MNKSKKTAKRIGAPAKRQKAKRGSHIIMKYRELPKRDLVIPVPDEALMTAAHLVSKLFSLDNLAMQP